MMALLHCRITGLSNGSMMTLLHCRVTGLRNGSMMALLRWRVKSRNPENLSHLYEVLGHVVKEIYIIIPIIIITKRLHCKAGLEWLTLCQSGHPSPTKPSHRKKDVERETVEDAKGTSCLIKPMKNSGPALKLWQPHTVKTVALLLNSDSLTPSNTGSAISFQEILRDKRFAVLHSSSTRRSICHRFTTKAPRVTHTGTSSQVEHHKEGASDYTWSITTQCLNIILFIIKERNNNIIPASQRLTCLWTSFLCTWHRKYVGRNPLCQHFHFH